MWSFWIFLRTLTFEDSEVGLLVLSADFGIVLKIYTNAAHFRWMNRFIQMLDDFAQQSFLSILFSILRIVYQHFSLSFSSLKRPLGLGIVHMICMFLTPTSPSPKPYFRPSTKYGY